MSKHTKRLIKDANRRNVQIIHGQTELLDEFSRLVELTESRKGVALRDKSYFKEDEEGVLTMCREMENMRKTERIEIAKRMLASGKLTYEDIATFTDLTLEEIKALAVQKTA